MKKSSILIKDKNLIHNKKSVKFNENFDNKSNFHEAPVKRHSSSNYSEKEELNLKLFLNKYLKRSSSHKNVSSFQIFNLFDDDLSLIKDLNTADKMNSAKLKKLSVIKFKKNRLTSRLNLKRISSKLSNKVLFGKKQNNIEDSHIILTLDENFDSDKDSVDDSCKSKNISDGKSSCESLDRFSKGYISKKSTSLLKVNLNEKMTKEDKLAEFEGLLPAFQKIYKESSIDFYLFSKSNDDNPDEADENYEKYVINNLKVIKVLVNILDCSFYLDKLEEVKNAIINEAKKLDSFSSSDKTLTTPRFNNSKDTLVIDLDETLIHSIELNNSFLKSKFNVISIEKSTKQSPDYYLESLNIGIYLRPGLYEFLDYAYENFNLILMSAGEKHYCEEVVKLLKLEKYFCMILSKDFCINVEDIYVKDLTCIKELYNIDNSSQCTDFIDILIVDNNIYSFASNLSQGILVSSYINDKTDTDLFDLIDYLKELVNFKKDSNLLMMYQNETHFYFETIKLNLEDG